MNDVLLTGHNLEFLRLKADWSGHGRTADDGFDSCTDSSKPFQQIY